MAVPGDATDDGSASGSELDPTSDRCQAYVVTFWTGTEYSSLATVRCKDLAESDLCKLMLDDAELADPRELVWQGPTG